MNDAIEPALKTSDPVTHDPFGGPALSAFFPITESQWEIWLASELGEDVNSSYNEGLEIILRGALDEAALRTGLQTVLDRHECLRASFSIDGEWVMVRERLELDLERHDVRGVPDVARTLAELERAEMTRPMDLEQGPLVRFTLVRTGDQEHHLFFVAHHAVCDGWSGAVVVTELAAVYSALVEKRQPALPPAPRYGDYSTVEQAFLQSETGREHLEYWLTKLKDCPPAPDLPSDRQRPSDRTYVAGERIDHTLAPELVAALRKLGVGQGASLVTTMLAGFAVLLHRLTGSEDLIIGLSAAGQSLHQMLGLVGQCVNMLPLRLRPRSEAAFVDFLKETRAEMLDAQDHQGATFGTLVQKLDLDRDPSRPPLISITFNIDVRNDDIRHTGLDVSYRTMVRQFENFEMYVNVVDNGRDLALEVCYNAHLFDADTIRRRVRELETILSDLCRQPDAALSSLQLLLPDERKHLLRSLNDTATSTAPDRPLHRWIEEQATRTPDAVAVSDETSTLSYRELNHRANQLAHWLRAQGVKRDTPVAACVQRTPSALVAFLGILKAGGAYLPLDPEYPPDRLKFMLEDAQPIALVTNFGNSALLGDEERLVLFAGTRARIDLLDADEELRKLPDSDSDAAVGVDALAYVIYTSGSTGRSKGTQVEHRGPLNQYQHYIRALRIDSHSRFLVFSSLGFDLTQRNLWSPLMVGGRVVLVSSPQYDVTEIIDLLERERITHLCCTPSAFYPLVDDADATRFQRLASLRQLALGGEAIQVSRLAAWRDNPHCVVDVTNCYGPTEASANVAMFHLRHGETFAGAGLPIGRPITNVQLYVLDRHGALLPPGVPGELHIGGLQLARDYLRRPELTAERFIFHPEFGRLYRTGDSCRLLATGDLEFLGRVDFQVKLRGFRVELGEIEAALDSHPAVQRSVCAVLDRSAGDPRLVAWAQFNTGMAADAGDLRAHLRAVLPRYMIPQQFVVVEALPLLSSGKIDRRSLPNPFETDTGHGAARIAPRNDVERVVFDIWRDVLGHGDFGIEDRFLDVGGHSLLAVQVAGRLRKAFSTAQLPLRLVMTKSLGQVAAACAPAAGGPSSVATPQEIRPARETSAKTIGDEPPGGLSRLKKWLMG